MTQSFSTLASKTCLAITFCVFTFLFLTGSFAHGDEFNRIDNMAKKIQKKSKLLIKETKDYRHTAQYRSLVDATTHLYEVAGHVHQVVHFANNLNHLQSDLADLDQYFHQLEGLFAAAEDAASRGHGEIHGSTAYARSLLRSIETSIDVMRKEVRKLQSRSVAQYPEVYSAATPGVTSPATGYAQSRGCDSNQPVAKPRAVYQQPRQASGFSFSIGGGSSGLQFNF